MYEASKVIMLIGNTPSTSDKQTLLIKNACVPGLKEILWFIYNPYNKTGISESKLAKAMKMTTSKSTDAISFRYAIDYFTRHRTGSTEDLIFARDFILYTDRIFGEPATTVAKGMVTQNLKIGVTATSLNKAYGASFIPKIGCMLGTHIKDLKKPVSFPCVVTEKLDGIRRILVKENGVCRMYSRSGIEDDGCVDILREAVKLPDNAVYDGELLATGTFKDSIELRQATNSIASSSGDKSGLTFNVFDMVALDEFRGLATSQPALTRKIVLAATLMDESINILTDRGAELIQAFGLHEELHFIKPVKILGLVHSFNEVEPIVESIWSVGGEGVMLNTTGGRYEIKRSKDLVKVKNVVEYTLPIVDFLPGDPGKKYENTLGALVLDYNGARVGAGSGLSNAQRDHIWANKHLYLGKLVEVESFGESTNASGGKSLNCAIFKRFVGDAE